MKNINWIFISNYQTSTRWGKFKLKYIELLLKKVNFNTLYTIII
jgi:hypothetical protein